MSAIVRMLLAATLLCLACEPNVFTERPEAESRFLTDGYAILKDGTRIDLVDSSDFRVVEVSPPAAPEIRSVEPAGEQQREPIQHSDQTATSDVVADFGGVAAGDEFQRHADVLMPEEWSATNRDHTIRIYSPTPWRCEYVGNTLDLLPPDPSQPIGKRAH